MNARKGPLLGFEERESRHQKHHGDKIEIALDEKTSRVSVRDYGRGIPLGKVVECVSQINTGAKYNDDIFQFSVGLNGVGLKAVNALHQKMAELLQRLA